MLDCTFSIQVPYRIGSLAQVMAAIAEGGGLIGDVVTVSVGREYSVREVTVEVRDVDHAARLAELIEELPEAQVLWHQDRAMLRHRGGKITIQAVNPIRTVQEMRDVYTPGVARVCRAIADRPQLAGQYTMISRSVAICTNGTRVLGLGNIGAVASMPVMEGKAVFYHQFAGLAAMPILIDTTDVDEFVETVVRIAPTFGAIHLEDISAPECFEIEHRLIMALLQPVMHDDVHGTAVVGVAAAMVACRHAGLEFGSATVGQIGLGAAGYGIGSLMVEAGARRVLGFDPQSGSHARAREAGVEVTDMQTVLDESDLLIAATGVPRLIAPEMIRPGQVVLALTNPEPEIEPEAARAAGAAFAADGRSVNNVLGYPGIFKGALAAGARMISLEMKLSAARAIAEMTTGEDLVPDPLDARVHDAVAEAVRRAADRSGVSRPEIVVPSL